MCECRHRRRSHFLLFKTLCGVPIPPRNTPDSFCRRFTPTKSIAALHFANAVPPQTLLRLFTANWKLSVIKYQQQILLSSDSPVRVCLYWNCALLLRSTSKEFSYCDAMLCCTVYTNQRDLVCRISATPDT